MSSFQSSVFIQQGFNVPGEIFQDVAWKVLSYTLNSHSNLNIVGSTAYTITSEGVAEAGNGGTHGFAGFLCAPKDYALSGEGGNPLAPTLQIPNFSQTELISQGMLAVMLPDVAQIGDLIVYDNTTGAISSIPSTESVPEGYTFAHATVSQFTQTIEGEGLAVIEICCGDSLAESTVGYTYEGTFWVDSNGDEAYGGINPLRPLSDLTEAFSKMVTGGSYVINVPGPVVFEGSYTIPAGVIAVFINAPGSTLQDGGANMFTIAGNTIFSLICGIINQGANNVVATSGSAKILIKAFQIIGNISSLGSGGNQPQVNVELQGDMFGDFSITSLTQNTLKCGTLQGDYTDTSTGTGTLRNGVFCRTVAGDISSTNNAIYGNVFHVDGSVSGIGRGIFGGALYGVTVVNTGETDGLTFESGLGSYTFPPNSGADEQHMVVNADILSWVS